jgi:uncharacterized repeat protein (TIGR03803 family)
MSAVSSRSFFQSALRRALCICSLMLVGAAQANDPLSTVYSFTGGNAGSFPYGTPIEASDGFLYGTTWFGTEAGTDPYSGWGLVYKIRPDGTERSTLYVFSGGVDGAIPYAPLIEGLDGAFYGVTEGSDGTGAAYGTVFRVSADGSSFTTLHSFTGEDGRFLTGALVQDSEGVLYGVTQAGGSADKGTVFSLRPDGSGFSTLHHFSGADGSAPVPGLTLGGDGTLYGVTSYNGSSDRGSVFKIERDGSGFSTLYAFAGGADGAAPYSSVLWGNDGYLYGSTNEGGGSCGCGTVFKLSLQGVLTTLHSFSGGTDGSAPRERMVQGSDGNLYGTTYNGGGNGAGTAYKVGIDGQLLGLLNLEWTSGLATGFAKGSDGRLYSSSIVGGANGIGAVFAVDPEAAFSQPSVPELSISADKTVLGPKQSAVISWSATDADSCEANGDGTFNGSAPLSGERRVQPLTRGSHTYTITCTGAGGSTASSVIIYKKH